MDEQTCRYSLEQYFEVNFELLSFIKFDTCSCDINFKCDINFNMINDERVNHFVNFQMKETNETIKLRYKEKDKQKHF